MKKVSLLLPALVLIGGLFLASCDRGDEYKQAEGDGATASAGDSTSGEYNEEEAQYPEEKVQDDTNLDDEDPLTLTSGHEDIQKRVLMASLLRQKNDLQNRIREIKSQSGSATTPPAAEMDQMETYVGRLDEEITKVRQASSGSLGQVEESAQGAIEGAGALIQSTFIRVDSGF